MKLLNFISEFISDIFGINSSYINLFLYSFIAYFLVKIVVKFLCFINVKFNKNDRALYLINRKINAISIIVILGLIVLIWESEIAKLMTLISVIGAALTFALRDFVFNFCSGIYINIMKPFKVEDRIEINGTIGDVININSFTFDLLEVGDKENGEQSTGIVIHVPNSKIFSNCVKNYTEAFKYIWDEISVCVPIDCDIDSTKTLLYEIVRGNDVIRKIPRKMKKELNSVVGEYRIYYNKLEPIIYTEIDEGKVRLTIRYLAHPKKVRNIRSDIYNSILNAFKDENLTLYLD